MFIFKTFNLNLIIKLLLIFLFTINLGESIFYPLHAVYITGSIPGASLKTVGFAVALYALAKSIVQIPLAKRLDKCKGEKDDFYVMLTGAVIGNIFALGFIVISSPIHYYILSIIGGIGAAFLLAAYYGIFARHVDKGSEGFEWSLFSAFALTISVAIGCAIGGIIADKFGFQTTFIIAGIISVSATISLAFLYPYLILKKSREVKT